MPTDKKPKPPPPDEGMVPDAPLTGEALAAAKRRADERLNSALEIGDVSDDPFAELHRSIAEARQRRSKP